MRTEEFDYALPPELIAQAPATERRASRLLHLQHSQQHDRAFADLPLLLAAGDVLVLNDTRVIRARLHGHKASGGAVEVMLERVLDERRALAQLRFSKAPRAGSELRFPHDIRATIIERSSEFWHLEFNTNLTSVMQRIGEIPLPPYIQHAPEASDDERYQTVYAREPGAVAAPTAGLHFDAALLAELQRRGVQVCYVTLHVGAGTFQPVRAAELAEHRMHSERFHIPEGTVTAIQAAKRAGQRVIAVGTTSLRALEAAAADAVADHSAAVVGTAAAATQANESQSAPPPLLRAGAAETDLFITPGYRFRVVDRLITNFHLPRSTLLMLVCAFGGYDNVMRAYQHAVAARYRFFSYGDAMLIEGDALSSQPVP